MKIIFTFLFITIFCLTSNGQTNYELGLVHLSGYDFKVVAIPDFDSSGNTDISDISFTLALPAGNVNVTNAVTFLPGRAWNIVEFEADQLTSYGLGDGTLDVFQVNVPIGQTLISHTSGQQIDLVSFTISNSPTSEEMKFLPNDNSIVAGAGGALDSYYNTDLDGPGGNPTTNYFSTFATGMESFNFASLSTNDIAFTDINILVYPNPTKGNLNIETNKTITYAIYNILGQSIKLSGELDSNVTKSINLSHLPDGIYILKAQDDNKNSKSFKIIKKE